MAPVPLTTPSLTVKGFSLVASIVRADVPCLSILPVPAIVPPLNAKFLTELLTVTPATV